MSLQNALAVAPAAPPQPARPSVAVLGLGYVGLPTGLALEHAGFPVIGVDVSARRLRDINDVRVDILASDRRRLRRALRRDRLDLTSDVSALARADAVLICVPTPIDEDRRPDLTILQQACETVVRHAQHGQTIVLTSTTSVGSTNELLVEPLAKRGLRAGREVHVAFSPERIDPGNTVHEQGDVPRVVGGVTPACAQSAATILAPIAARVHVVSSAEAAELTKLYENTFRAVNIALANEVADACSHLGLDPIEVTNAAATKPYGYMPFFPGPGVGGHCIPCDPHYLAAPLRRDGKPMPLVEQAMRGIAERPHQVVDRAAALLARHGVAIADARVLLVGAAYKPGVEDVRESPSLDILMALRARGARVDYHDPLVAALELPDGLAMLSRVNPRPEDYELALIACMQPGDHDWLDAFPLVLDATYRAARSDQRKAA